MIPLFTNVPSVPQVKTLYPFLRRNPRRVASSLGNQRQDLDICSLNGLSVSSPYYATPLFSISELLAIPSHEGIRGNSSWIMAFLTSLLRFNFLGFAKAFTINLFIFQL